MLQYYYCNSALIIYICTLYLFYVKKHIIDNQTRFYKMMLWTGFFACCFDIISEEAIRNTEQYPIWLFYLIMYIYFILQNSIPYLSSLYALEIIDKRRSLKSNEKIKFYAPAIIAGILLLTNNLTRLVFYIDNNGDYHHGIGFGYLFIQSGYYLVLNIVYIFRYKKIISKTIRFMIPIMSAAIMFIIILDQLLDQVMIQNFSISVCLLLLFIVIQNAEEEMEDFTGLFTLQALIRHVQIDFINRKPFTIILIKLEDKTIINFTFGTNYWFSLINEVSIYLKSLDGLHDVYNIEDGLFAIKLRSDLPFEKKDKLLKSITSKFELSKWSVLNMDLSISIRMLEISYPTDIEEMNDLFYFIKYFNENVINSKSKLLKTADLSIDKKNLFTEKKKELMNILDSFQYELCFMPIFSVSENKVIAREPLLKLPTVPPTYVSPCDLDHETEDYRKLREIHLRIFEDICIYLKNNLSNTEDRELIIINVDVTHLMHEGLFQQYGSIINAYQLDYHIFGIEISKVMDYYDQPIIYRNIKELENYGLPFILDQFGTGHSNFKYFKYIPFKYVKLDKSFVKKSVDNEKGISILMGIIAMMNSLHISMIADGVETKEMADTLISLGIDHLQGTYFS